MKPTSMDAAICANAVLGGGLMDLEPEEVDLRIGEMLERAEEVKNAFEEERKTRLFEFMDEISFGDEVIEYFKEQLEPKTYDETIEYIREFSLYGEDVEYRRTKKYPGVLLITAHSSKGLEWPVVYVTENKFPMGSAAMEETRRLFFVSATRARDELYVSGVFNLGTKDRVKHNRLLQEAYDIKGYAYPVL
jgi:superfamily I DNA/RNA helicase